MGKMVAFITGATSGIGAAFARHFAGEGYDLILTGHPDDSNNLLLDDLKQKFNVDIRLIFADLSVENDIAKLEELIKKNDKIEVLVNNAGYLDGVPFLKNTSKKLEQMIMVHINSPMRFVHAVLPNMLLMGRGIIINLSSLAAYTPFPDYAMYPATKMFNIGFTESLHITLRKKGIKLQVLCPGFVKTNFHKRAGVNLSEFKNRGLIKWLSPEKVVQISIRNLKKKNKVIVVPGFVNKLIRIMSLIIPRRIYYKLASQFLN
jgi:hypothetical protein